MQQRLNPGFQMKEAQSHGDIFFPLDYYACSIPGSFTFLPVHWHEEMEITWIQSGSCTYQMDLSAYPVEAGDILLLPPRILHGVQEGREVIMASKTFVFRLEFLGLGQPDACSIKYLNPLNTHTLEIPFLIRPNDPGHDDLIPIFLHLIDIYQKKEKGFELEIKAELLRFLSVILRASSADIHLNLASPEKSEKLRQVIDYINHHYEEPLRVRTLAAQSGFSEYHFMHFFKKYTGMTVTNYVNKSRLSAASRLLLETGLPITEIAFASGFNNISYFNRTFKKLFQMTPKEFRQNRCLAELKNL